MTAQEARTHIRYSGWASRKALEAALALAFSRYRHGRHSPAWLGPRAPSHDALPSFDFVIGEWPRLQAKREAWADAATDAEAARQVPFKSRFVADAGLPAWQIIMHVVNDAMLHRGQIIGMLRPLGVKPPATDIVFYDEQAAS